MHLKFLIQILASTDVYKSEFEFRYGQEFSLPHVVQTGSGAHPASYSMGTEGSFLGGQAAGAWSWPLTSTSAEVNKTWIYTSNPPYVFMA
jgi:hypothetical protein